MNNIADQNKDKINEPNVGISTLLDRIILTNNNLEEICDTVYGKITIEDKCKNDGKKGLISGLDFEINRYNYMKEELRKSLNLINDSLYS